MWLVVFAISLLANDFMDLFGRKVIWIINHCNNTREPRKMRVTLTKNYLVVPPTNITAQERKRVTDTLRP